MALQYVIRARSPANSRGNQGSNGPAQNLQAISSVKLPSFTATTIMATCRDAEGWRTVSRIREFDTTPCFEEGVILSLLLGGLFVVGAWKSLRLSLLAPRSLTSKSRWILRSKIVSILVSNCEHFANLRVFRHFSSRHLLAVLPISVLYFTWRRQSQFYSPTFLNLSRLPRPYC